jgi:hypothetical protein
VDSEDFNRKVGVYRVEVVVGVGWGMKVQKGTGATDDRMNLPEKVLLLSV